MNRNRSRQRNLTQAILKSGGQLYMAEYILGTLRPLDMQVPTRLIVAKAIWNNGGSVEDVLQVLAPLIRN